MGDWGEDRGRATTPEQEAFLRSWFGRPRRAPWWVRRAGLLGAVLVFLVLPALGWLALRACGLGELAWGAAAVWEAAAVQGWLRSRV